MKIFITGCCGYIGSHTCVELLNNNYEIVDLANGHVKAVEKFVKEDKGLYIYNLGTGVGYSVLDMINAFEKTNGIKINYKIVDRRPGDIAECFSDPTKAKEELNFSCTKTLDDMVRDSWNYESNNKK